MRITLVVLLTFILTPAWAACSKGDPGHAYQLGHSLAFTGVDTTAAREVASPLRTCFVLGYREGTLQRLLRTSQPNPPVTHLVRPRATHKG